MAASTNAARPNALQDCIVAAGGAFRVSEFLKRTCLCQRLIPIRSLFERPLSCYSVNLTSRIIQHQFAQNFISQVNMPQVPTALEFLFSAFFSEPLSALLS